MEITFYTDPLCCWTWAMQPQWRKLQDEFQSSSYSIRYKMGGLIPSWKHFSDDLHSIRKPAQMGPEWMHAKSVSGMPINDRIWVTDPPASSFPACIAVKCAELQSPELGANYLNLLQEAVMVKSRNISKTDVLVEAAYLLSRSNDRFNLFTFRDDLFGDIGKEAFRRDLQECKYLNVNRLPTIRFKAGTRFSMLLSGYQSYESLKSAWLKNLCGSL